ncbi:MAG: hypothetical protein VR64_07135 [Desulfatitalea sp. BRH_c12]|nr:MAG: hypothetical protein VR64_07135 [Desulfatitalea sp. BRH_c12]
MKILVGYNASSSAQRALSLACEMAKNKANAFVYVVTSMEGGSNETIEDIRKVEEKLQEGKDFLLKEHVACEAVQLARGLSPGEDLVKFAQENGVEHIFLGIQKKSRTQKLLLGSTAQFIILKGPCPVTTTK